MVVSHVLAVPALVTDERLRPTRWRTALRWVVLDAAFWAAVTLLFAGQYWVFSGVDGTPVRFVDMLVDQIGMWLPCALLTPAAAVVALRARFVEGERIRAAFTHVVAALAFAALGGGAMGLLAWLMPDAGKPVPLLATIWRGVLGGFTLNVLVYGAIVAVIQAAAYRRESRDRQVAAAQLQRELTEARLHAVTTQLQPHFLFNTLNAVAALVRSNPAQAERTIGRLGDLLRYALVSVDEARTTLRDEISFLEKYVEIQQARFGDRLRVTLDVDPVAGDAVVPRLLLQPLVENAIRHGISPRAAPGRVDVHVWRENGSLRFTVRDDGVGLPAAFREGVGLTATRARLRQEYPAAHEFSLTPAAGGGAVAQVVIPFRVATAELGLIGPANLAGRVAQHPGVPG